MPLLKDDSLKLVKNPCHLIRKGYLLKQMEEKEPASSRLPLKGRYNGSVGSEHYSNTHKKTTY